MPRAVLGLLVLTASGCYLAHESVGDDGTCVPDPPLGGSCGVVGTSTTVLPDGVCRLSDGTVLAFVEGDTRTIGCEVTDDPHQVGLGADCGRGPSRLRVHRCHGAAASGELSFGAAASFDPAPGTCELRVGEGASEPWRPFVDANEICVDASPWCGAPIFIDLLARGADRCGGGYFAERCEARVDATRIVVTAETARADSAGCDAAPGDRVARCVVPPLSPGNYEVVDVSGRVLITLDVAERGASSERACVPIGA